MTKTDSSRMHCGHCGASVRVRVNGTPFVHDDPSTGKRCETTPHRRRSLGQLPDSGEPLTAQFSVSMGQARLARLDAMLPACCVDTPHDKTEADENEK